MIRDLNKLDLMIAALYLRYRRRSDHILSALWAKTVFGMIGMMWVASLFEWIRFILKLPRPIFFQSPLLLGVVYLTWALCTFIIHKCTLSFEVLSKIDLYPEDYMHGNKLAFYFFMLSICLAILPLTWLGNF